MQTVDRYRRARGVVIYWRESQAVCFVWPASRHIPIGMPAAGILHDLSDWTTATELRDRLAPSGDIVVMEETLQLLLTLNLVEREGDAANDQWTHWSPYAAFNQIEREQELKRFFHHDDVAGRGEPVA